MRVVAGFGIEISQHAGWVGRGSVRKKSCSENCQVISIVVIFWIDLGAG